MAEEEEGVVVGDETEAASVSVSASTSVSPSPETSPKASKQKIKLRCSHGGKIMVRPPDGRLKYVGGETRVVAIPRDITFSELMKKLSGLVDGDMVLKYQLVPEDLDTFVTVRTDEDLKHMMEEYDRLGGTPKMRAYLFPSKPVVLDRSLGLASHALEQRYIDAINGIIRTTPPPPPQPITGPCSERLSFSISSPCSSPQVISPDKLQNPWDGSTCSSPKSSQLSMHRVRSSPSMYYGGDEQQGSGSSYFSRQPAAFRHPINNHTYGHHFPQQHGGLYPTNSLQLQDFDRGSWRMEQARSGLMSPAGMDRLYLGVNRPYRYIREQFDEGNGDGSRAVLDRSDSLPHAPREVVWE